MARHAKKEGLGTDCWKSERNVLLIGTHCREVKNNVSCLKYGNTALMITLTSAFHNNGDICVIQMA